MKKMFCLITLVCYLCSSCATTSTMEHHVSEDQALLWSLLPGGGQFAIGEYWEGGLRAASILGPMMILGAIAEPETEAEEGAAAESSENYNPMESVLAVGILAIWAWAAVDAYYSSQDHYVPVKKQSSGKSYSHKLPFQVRDSVDQLHIGDSESTVYKVLGVPSDVNSTELESGIHKQLVYYSADIYVYTENGVVTAIQK